MVKGGIKTNIPLDKLLEFRETGYIYSVIKELLKLRDFGSYELFVYFKLSSYEQEIHIPPSPKKQIIFIVSDESQDVPLHLKKQAFAIFRNYLPENEVKDNLFHLPIGYSRAFVLQNNIPFEERNINVFFSGNLHTGRAALFKFLTKLYFVPFSILHRLQNLIKLKYDNYYPQSIIRFSRGFHNGLGADEYSTILANSKIVLCPPGLENVETMRLFEAIQVGSIIISERLPQVYCYKDSPIIIVKDWRELDEIIPRLLADPEEMKKLHEQTVAWWHSHASDKATAAYINAIINNLEGKQSV